MESSRTQTNARPQLDARSAAGPGSGSRNPGGDPLNLLLADHPDADATALEACLEHAGLDFQMTRCHLPGQVDRLLQDHRFDLVLVDVEFAGRQTLDEMADLLRQPLNQRPPLLVLAPATDVRTARQAITLGAQGLVERDCVSPATLRASVDLALSHARQCRAAARQREAMWRQSMHDGLTGLANRHLLRDRLDQALGQGRRSGTTFAVVTLDLDRFGQINEHCGQLAGDQVLCEVGARLRAAVRRSDTLARLGGNQFCALLPAIGGPLQATRLAEKLRRALSRPYRIEGFLADPGVSLGIALFPGHGDSVSTLLRRSEQAMFEAKRRGGGVTIFADEATAPRPRLSNLAQDLARALRGQGRAPELWVRPQLCLDSGTCVGAEVFARWRHAERGLLGPQELVQLAERADLIKPLTRHLLDLSLSRLIERDGPGPALTLSLPPQLLSQPPLVDVVARRLAATGVDRSSLLLDFDEGAAIAQGGAANHVLRRLVGLGLRISVSGVGGALSSFKFLRDFPLAELRIHRDFVSQMVGNLPDARICGILFNLAESLDLRAVACGVGDARTSRRLQELGCRFGVGPALSREMPLADFDEWRAQLHVLPLARRFARKPSGVVSPEASRAV